MTDHSGARTDAELVAAAAAGSDLAFRALYRSHVRAVYALARAMVGTATDAEDVTQETFLVAWRKIGGLQLVSESLLPWLVTICRFQAANRVRRQKRDREHLATGVDETLPATIDVERAVIDADLADRIAAQLSTLGELDQEIFRLCAAEGYGYREAADRLGVSHGAVRNRLSRIRSSLRTTITSEGS
ncbi:RNA polymerase sigma factor, sigma-70 family [Microbacterium laevaniformans OR221]|jgi:RNA polymerase sigma-70 factor (ECF subfamily)|nr:RNA polymerase sigma factor, sigma-70 family [Microbacterium laevaniformans OR221]